NKELSKTLDYRYVELLELLQLSDIVTLHVPALKSTYHLINKDSIFQMKKGSILINTARGNIVETKALSKAISTGHLSGAGLDVLEDETALGKNLTNRENVIITPHTAFYTVEAEQAIMQTTVENIQGFIKNKPQNTVS